MISEQEARVLADEWRPKFVETETFDASWKRCFELVGDVDRKRLVQWLGKDRTREAAMYAGLTQPPVSTHAAGVFGACGGCGRLCTVSWLQVNEMCSTCCRRTGKVAVCD